MRVLLTGAAGFIGSHIAEELTTRGHEVVSVDNLLPQAHSSVPEWTNFVRGDVQDFDLMTRLLDGVDAVCHQAAVVGHGLDPSDAPLYVRNNDHGTAVVLAAMHSAGVRKLVLASSMVVYGEGRYVCSVHGDVRPEPRVSIDLKAGRYEPSCPICGDSVDWALIEEDAPLDPRSTYAATKVAQEHLASTWARQADGNVWALRYHNVYGPRMARDTPYAGVAALFRSALERGEAPTVLEDGMQLRDFVHVTDVAVANVLALESSVSGFVPVNVCSGSPHTVGELAQALASAYGGPSPQIVGGARSGDVRHIVASPVAAQRLLGFQARVGFAEGVRAFASDPLRA
ncbi:NAD-dependent epimerase/dehydratase family protein [Kibdelosporangium philippinense]|uniref:NAD-dependent epimerase/dehydratase family protein n=1 Tax=Kibdelosporangium philippinense TaxID=211113 RepID=A0ABS8ZNM0_9PSEU|nr:NAD-dependent epimerase/dehydratase family protein [Kibdelosporangium philippinense]MCE7008803.1 NAD-dependent epimerase/dehydratase family protein [Kibdelosporangium philippinense]